MTETKWEVLHGAGMSALLTERIWFETQIHYYETFTACVKRCIAAGLDENEEQRNQDEEDAKMYIQKHSHTHTHTIQLVIPYL